MTQPTGTEPAASVRVHAELRALRESIVGVDGSLVATSDGLLVAHDVPNLEPTRLAALVSATLSLARQAVAETGRGEFREALARGTAGYLMVYAAGGHAVVAILCDARVNVGMVQYQAREAIERITGYAADFARWSGAANTARSWQDDLGSASLIWQVRPSLGA
jgi:predicted regulator of Ras-like GTPase activity (Roadblock/LC7/MglB family)